MFSTQTTWAQMLQDLRRRSNLSKSDLARSAGVSIGYISKLETDKKPPPEAQRAVLAEILNLSPDEIEQFHIQAEIERTDPVAVRYLMRLVEQSAAPVTTTKPQPIKNEHAAIESTDNLHAIPIINKAAAGYPQDFTDLDYPVGIADGYIGVTDVTDPNAFGFYACGDSMEPDFPDGTLLIAAPNAPAFDGDPCFIRFSPLSRQDGCSFKRVYFMPDGQVRLVPINRRYAEQVFNRDEITGLWPVVRCYARVQRGVEKRGRRNIERGGSAGFDTTGRSATAAG